MHSTGGRHSAQHRGRGTRLPNVLTDTEVERLVGATGGNSPLDMRTWAMVSLMLGAGLRVSEVVSLRGSDVDLENGIIHVRGGKGGKDRTIPIDRPTADVLAAWADVRSTNGLDGQEAFYCRLRKSGSRPNGRKVGGGVSSMIVQRVINDLARRAGIQKRVTPHTLRHTYATRLLDNGFTIREVQELLGHSDVSTTMIYTHVNPVALREKIQGEKPVSEKVEEPDLPAENVEVRKQINRLIADVEALGRQMTVLLARTVRASGELYSEPDLPPEGRRRSSGRR